MTRYGLMMALALTLDAGPGRADVMADTAARANLMAAAAELAALVDAIRRADAMAAAAEAAADAREMFMAGDQSGGLALLIPLAETGNMRAQNIVGAAYQYGRGVPMDATLALHYLSMSAAQLYPPALFNLGYLYEVGMQGIPANPVAARTWYTRAAALDYPPALGNLGSMQIQGIGGPVDTVAGFRNLDRGATLDDSNAIEWLAFAYATGIGIEIDLVSARRYYAMAAAIGEPAMAADYAGMLERGEGGPVDLHGAMTAYLHAVAGGNAYAGIGAAWLHFDHPDLFPDYVQGVGYCLWAAAHAGPEDVAEWTASCDDAARDLTANERRQAEKFAAGL